MTVDLVRAAHLRLRALAATLLVMAGSAAAHTWAGGHLPGVPVLLGLGCVVGVASLLVLRGAVSRRVLLPLVALAQAGLHTGFALVGPAGDHAGHAMGTGAGGEWTGRMLLAHALSTALVALAWWLCDRALLAVLTRRARLAQGIARPRPVSLVPSPRRALLAHLVSAPRRGPPALARCA